MIVLALLRVNDVIFLFDKKLYNDTLIATVNFHRILKPIDL